MIRFNRLHFIASVLVVTLSITSCKQDSKSKVAASEFSDSNSSTIFVSSDNKHKYIVIANPGSTDGKITVHDYNANKEYDLHRTESASGIKYVSEDGYALWTKGSEFTWSKDDETIAKGNLKTTEFTVKKELEISKFDGKNYGNYVNNDYAKKDDGYDWVAVIVEPIDRFRVKLSVRSRGDKKKGTCTFDAIGQVSDENTLIVNENGMNISFTFNDDEITISTDSESDKLAYFCSGGASISETYSKIEGDLDANQIDKIGYSKSIAYNDTFFVIKENGGEVTVSLAGLEADKEESYPINGEIINTEVDDLNNDTFPELLIYTKSGADDRGEVIGFSVNNGKSISPINIPKISENSEVNQGYKGHDEFAMVEGTFIQRFPIYENNVPTGKIRQIQYNFEESEAIKQLVVNKIMDY